MAAVNVLIFRSAFGQILQVFGAEIFVQNTRLTGVAIYVCGFYWRSVVREVLRTLRMICMQWLANATVCGCRF